MSLTASSLEENPEAKPPPSPSPLSQKWPAHFMSVTLSELKAQRGIALPLVAMNLTWFAKIAITTAFLGRLGELQLAGGTLGFTFANVTGYSVLNGLCGAMEPICGQAHGAKNFKLLHKTLVMAILLLLLATLPISFVWLNVDKILNHFGQQEEITIMAERYLFHLLPDLGVTSFLSPLKSYLSSQGMTVPIMLSSGIGVALHMPINILLSKAKGVEGVSMAVWITDLLVLILLGLYVLITECGKGGSWKEGGWLEQGGRDWARLLKLSGPCCLTACLEWWCIEILVLLTGQLADAKQALGVLAIVLNFDYLLYSFMLSLFTCTSIRVSNLLGSNQARPAYESACVSLVVSVVSGCIGGLAMVAARGLWGPLFSHDRWIIKGVKKVMLLMALGEVLNFPVSVCGGIVRGTARPWLTMYANLGGFYLLALPLGAVLAFKVRLGLTGILIGWLVGVVCCLLLFVVFVSRIDWDDEAGKAQILVGKTEETIKEEGDDKNLATLEGATV